MTTTTKTETREVKLPVLTRAHSFERAAIDETKRTVDLSFSSEEPVLHWVNWDRAFVILDHDPKSVRLGRLADKGPVLVDHDIRDHVGVHESVSIGSDRRGRATVRFGKSKRAEEIFHDVVDGIRDKTSTRFRLHELVLEKKGEEGSPDTYRATDWEPLETSIVAIGADPTVGVGRGAEAEDSFPCNIIQERTMPPIEQPATPAVPQDPTPARAAPATPAAPTVDINHEREQARKAEHERSQRILAIGDKYEASQLARKYVDEGKSVDDFIDALANQRTEEAAQQKPVTELGFSRKDLERYSLIRALNAAVEGNWKRAGFELECSQAIAEAMGREAKGFFVPYDVQERGHGDHQRVMTVGTDTAGGYLVGTDHMVGSFIDNLRARAVLGRLGATMLPGLRENVSIPKKTGSATFYVVSEDGSPTDSELTHGQVLLRPRTIAGAVPISRQLLKQSAPAIEALVVNDLVVGASLKIDDLGINGTGANNQPVGLANLTGVATSTIASAGTPTWVEIVEFESDVDTANALEGTLGYLTTPAVFGTMKTTSKDAGSGVFIASDNGMVNGYRCLRSSQVATNGIHFGDWSSLLIGMWGVLDLVPDTATKVASGGLVVRVFQDLDIGFRHPESFCNNA